MPRNPFVFASWFRWLTTAQCHTRLCEDDPGHTAGENRLRQRIARAA